MYRTKEDRFGFLCISKSQRGTVFLTHYWHEMVDWCNELGINSSTEEFLRQVQPAYALISAGQENQYGHPHQETVKRIADVGSGVYSTQENGAIIIEVEGGKILRMEK